MTPQEWIDEAKNAGTGLDSLHGEGFFMDKDDQEIVRILFSKAQKQISRAELIGQDYLDDEQPQPPAREPREEAQPQRAEGRGDNPPVNPATGRATPQRRQPRQ